MEHCKRIIARLLIFVMVVTSVGVLPVDSSWATEGGDKSSVTVYLSISDDGTFVTGNDTDKTVISHVPVTVDYFDLADYGLEEFYRYEADSFENGGQYIGTEVIKQPTVLHLLIRAVEQYYLDGEKVEIGSEALNITGGATSMYMKNFWGHDENLMYFVNHAYPLMAGGWGSTADYILLEDGMEIDIAMFSDWEFYTYGAFAYFTPTKATVDVGEPVSLQMRGVSTFEDVNGKGSTQKVMSGEDLVYALQDDAVNGYTNDQWETFDVVTDDNGMATVSFDRPGTYYVSSTPYYETFQSDTGTSCVAPPIATITVTGKEPDRPGEGEDLSGTENLTVLSDLKFTQKSSASSAVYSLTPAFDAAKTAYTVYVPDTADSVTLWGSPTTESQQASASVMLTAAYKDTSGTQKSVTKEAGSSTGMYLPGLLRKGEQEVAVEITASCGLSSQTYTVQVVRIPTLGGMEVKDHSGTILPLNPSFTSETASYQLSIPAGTSGLELDLCTTEASYEISVDGTKITGGKASVTLTSANPQNVEICVMGTKGQINTYTLSLHKKKQITYTFQNLISGATLQLTNSQGVDLYKDTVNSSHLALVVQEDETYRYKLSLKGYETKNGTFTAGASDGVIDGGLVKVNGNTSVNPQIGSIWPNLRGNNENNGVTAAKTPTAADQAQLYWAVSEGGSWSGAPSSPIFVGEDLVFTTKSEIVKIDRVTGKTIKKNTMISRSAFSLVPPTYADGMIFVALGGGRVQAFNAETLESLWVYQDTLGGQPDSPILYHDGYVYTGFWNSEKDNANYVAILAEDEKPAEAAERKEAAWSHTHKGGFYWAGAIAAGGAIVVGSENGEEKESISTGVLYAFHPTSGKILDKITDIDGDIRSSIVLDKTTGTYYFVSRGGSFYSIKVNGDGTFDKGSLKKISLGGAATSTPAIHNGRAYIGVAGSNSLGAYSGHSITVIDLTSQEIAYQVPTRGYPQASGLLSTGYLAEDGYTYVYFIENYSPGIMRVIKDKPGQTQAVLTEVNNGILGEREADDYKHFADTLFTPRGEQANYAIGSPIVDEYGTMYFKNDSSYIMALGSKIESIEVTERPTKTEYKAGENFDPTGMKVVAHLANGMTRDVTAYVTYPTKALTAYDLEVEITYPYVMYNDKEKKCDQPSTYVPVASITAEEVNKIQNVIDLINQIKTAADPEGVTIAARTAYDDLGTKLQKYVPNEDVLIDYELSFAEANITKGAPEGMTVTVTVEGYNSLKLTWNQHNYASGYEVYRSTTAGIRGSLIKTVNGKENTTLVNSGVTAGKTYYYTVRPYILVDGTKIGDLYSPQAAGSTTITAPVVTMEKTAFDSVQLSWQPVSGASGYYVYRNDGSGYVKYKTFVKGTDAAFADTGLECGKTYQYKVTSWRGETESESSEEISVSIVLEKVSGVKAKRGGYASVTLTWNGVDGAEGYHVYRREKEKKSFVLVKKISGEASVTYKDKGLTTGKTYQYKIEAYRGDYNATPSDVASAKPTLSKMTGVKAAKTGYASVRISWKKVDGAKGYKIYRYDTKKKKYTLLKTIKNGKTVSYTNTGLKTGTTYKYKVKAYRGTAENAFSSIVSAKPTLAKVKSLKAKGQKKVKLTWTKVPGADGYVIYRSNKKNGKFKQIQVIKKGKTTTFTQKKLKKGKKFYYKIRAYRKVGGKKVYSTGYTASKVVKVK